MSNLMNINQHKLQQLRIQRCWSQEELATAAGVSVRTIQRVEKNGKASLETLKALSSVLELAPHDLTQNTDLRHRTFSIICKFGGMVSIGVSIVLMSMWLIDIVIPTLKGASFDQQYEMHGNFRYLDLSATFFVIGFLWLGANLLIEYFKSRPAKPLEANTQLSE